MRKNISMDDFYVQKIRRTNRQEEVKASISIDKEEAAKVAKRFEKKEEDLRSEYKSEAEAIVLKEYGATKSDENYAYYVELELNALVKKALREQLSKGYSKSVDETEEEALPISQLTSGDLGIKKVDIAVLEKHAGVDDLDKLVDRRNQQFKIDAEYLEVEGEEIRNVYFEYARSFKSFYWINSGRISIGEERPRLEPGEFFLFNKGIMNRKKMDTLSFAVARYLGCKQEDLAPVWFENKPHFYEESTRRLVEINVVDGKAFGYKDGIKKI